MIKNILKILLIFVFGIFGGIFGSEILWPYFVERPLFYQYRLEQNPIYINEKKEIYIQENTALKNAIEKVEGAVVLVRTKTKEGKIINGSGLILTSDGLVITLSRFLPTGGTFSFFVENEIVDFRILKRDEKEGLVLVKLEKKNLKTTGFFNLEKLKLGERVFLVGKVFKEGKINTIVNEGIIKSLNEERIETNIRESEIMVGSPLFDIEGNLIGLCEIEKDGTMIVIPNSKIKTFVGI